MKDQISEFESITDKVIDYEGNEKYASKCNLLGQVSITNLNYISPSFPST